MSDKTFVVARPAAAAPRPSEIMAQGRVVETRDGLLVIRLVPVGEESFEVRPNDAGPGDYVWIYNDGQVEVRGQAKPEPIVAVPMAPEPDHS